MSSLLVKIGKIIALLVSACISLILLFILPSVFDSAYNQIRLAVFEFQANRYSHPPDSKLIQKISILGNFAPASNQCGFIVTEIRTTILKHGEIHTFYAPILTDLSYDGEPPHKNVTLYIANNKKDVKNIELFYPDVYERIPQEAMNNTHAYLLITSETGYPPNNDPRCH